YYLEAGKDGRPAAPTGGPVALGVPPPAPSGDITAAPLDNLGVTIIRGRSAEELKAVEDAIKAQQAQQKMGGGFGGSGFGAGTPRGGGSGGQPTDPKPAAY